MPLNLADPQLAQRIVDATPAIALVLDTAGRVEYLNPFGEQFVGGTLAELRGQDWFDLFLPDDEREAVRERFQAELAGSPPQRRSSALITRDGQRRQIEWSARRMFDEKSQVVGLLATGQDVTERLAAEAALRERELGYRRLFEANPQPMWVYDPQTLRFLAVNDAAVSHYGYSHDEFLAMRISDIRLSTELPALREDLALAQGLRRDDKIWQHLRKDGSVIDVEISAHSLAFEGRPARMVMAEDITLRRRAEQALLNHRNSLEHEVRQRTAELVAARDEAERANRAKSTFLSRMSHELRTPLNAILGFSQLMASDSGLKPKHHDFVNEMLRAGRHLLHLVNDVLDLASIESGRLTLSPEPLRLAELLGDCLRMIVPLAKARGVVIEVSGAENLVLRADRTRLRQVLLNLLSNAVKYNRPGGQVSIDAAAISGERVRLSVTDTGPGIPQDRLSKLFQPFERLGAEFGEIEGTGVGLTIARQLIEMMGGEIGVDGRPGLGARFWIVLPSAHLAPAPAVPFETPASSAPAGSASNWLTVLYVEDNPANLRLVEQIAARHARLRLLSADAAQPGLALARSVHPDLILLDIHLPDGDGYAVLAQLKADEATRHIPVVAVTAHAMPEDLRRAQAAGFADCITKPVDIQRLDALFQSLRVAPGAA